jgi:hypothetical protein
LPTQIRFSNFCEELNNAGLEWLSPNAAGNGNQTKESALITFKSEPRDESCRLRINNSFIGDDKSNQQILQTRSIIGDVYGGFDSWGASLSVEDINDNGNGFCWAAGDTSDSVSQYLFFSNFDFSIPANATIESIKATVTYEVTPGEGGFQSFVSGTQIKTTKGFKKIEDIKINDFILSYNEILNIFESDQVIALFNNTTNKTLLINNIVECTPEHLFLTKEGWISAEKLKINDKVLGFNEEIKIQSLE